jgi:hypothetical protein
MTEVLHPPPHYGIVYKIRPRPLLPTLVPQKASIAKNAA